MSHENAARQPKGIPAGGQFAPDLHAEPDTALEAPAAPARPIRAVVNFQVWRNDYAMDVGTAEFDAAPILASLSREQRQAIADGDHAEADVLYEEARRLGLVDDHDGPFWVDVESELTDAMAEGWDPEPTDPPETPSPVPFATAEDRDAHMGALEAQIGRLRLEYARTGMVGLAREIREAFPEATRVELKEDEYKSSRMACEAVYGADGRPLDESAHEELDGILRYYDPDYYGPLLRQEIDLDEAIAWHPGKDA